MVGLHRQQPGHRVPDMVGDGRTWLGMDCASRSGLYWLPGLLGSQISWGSACRLASWISPLLLVLYIRSSVPLPDLTTVPYEL